MNRIRKILVSIIAVVSCIFGNIQTIPVHAATETTDFYKTVMIDCGRGYYSVDQIKTIINAMEEDDYDQLMLAFGNDGLRFVLDDMSVTANGKTYDSDTIKNAISNQNKALPQNNYSPNTSASAGAGVVKDGKSEWTQSEMEEILAYAASKRIDVIPMIDVPGHATSIVAAIDAVGISNGYLASTSDSTDLGSATINIENSEAYNFTLALLQKYVDYFQSKGCKDFNFAMDEFMGNNGGYSDMTSSQRSQLATFVTDLHTMAVNADMNMIAFCDVIGSLSGGGYSIPSDNTLIGINWNGGYLSGHRNINANMNWYYVLGSPFGTSTSSWSSYAKSKYYLQNTTADTVVSGTAGAGCLLAIWNDSYYAAEDSYIDEILDLMDTQSSNNPNYFTRKQYKTINLKVGETITEALSEGVTGGDYDTSNPSIASAFVTTEAVTGTALSDPVTTITSGRQYVIEINRNDSTPANRVLTSTLSGTSNKFLTLDGTPSVDSEAWTITSASSGYYLQNSEGKYMTVGSSQAGISTTTTAMSGMKYVTSASSWEIGNGTYYLNQYGGKTATTVGGYTAGAASDTGSRWTLYEVTETTTDSSVIKFTGLQTGTTTIEIANTVYTINVREDAEYITIPVGGTYTTTIDSDVSGDYVTNNPSIATVTASYSESTAESLSYSATASSSLGTYSSYATSNMIDGSTSTYYWSSVAQAKWAYVQVDIGEAIPFDTVGLSAGTDSGDICEGAYVYVSETGADNSWVQIGEYTGSSSITTFAMPDDMPRARYIRVQIMTAKSNWWKMAEIQWGNTVDGTFTRMASSGTVEIPGGAATTLTFEGLQIGETYVNIGGTKYVIQVVEEDLSGVSLSAYPFISDYPVYVTGTDTSSMGNEGVGNPQQIGASEDGVHSEEGAELANLVWESGDWRWEGDAVETKYWKGVLHQTSTTHQVGSKDDQSLSGFDFYYIRYYGGKWSVSEDRETWVDVADTDEVCVYYLQETVITSEITTFVKDWAYTTADFNSYNGITSNGGGHKALSIGVVYPDGSINPAEGDIYADSTLIYWANTGTKSESDTLMVYFQDNEYYSIEKVTYTFGKIASESASGGSLTWEKTTSEDGTTWFDETECWNSSSSSSAAIQTSSFLAYGEESNKFDAAGDAMLLLVYVTPKKTESSLGVHYVNKMTGEEFYDYSIAVTDTVDNIVTFDENIGLNDPWKGTLLNGTVTNSNGVDQTVNANLSSLPNIDRKYSEKNYTCTSVERSEDGKDVYLYYEFEEITIVYKTVIDGVLTDDTTNCTTSLKNEIPELVDDIDGSTPVNNNPEEYEFVGWYLDEACETPVSSSLVDSDTNTITPPYETKTYYALFKSKDKYSITVTKTVLGNLGDRNEDFNFSIDFGSSNAGETFAAVHSTDGGIELTANENGVATFSLKDGESITVSGLKESTIQYMIGSDKISDTAMANLKVSEDDYSGEGYTTQKIISHDADAMEITVDVINRKEGVVPTGHHDDGTSIPYAIFAGIGVIFYVLCRKRGQKPEKS